MLSHAKQGATPAVLHTPPPAQADRDPLFYAHRRPSEIGSQPLAELARVVILAPVQTMEGDEVGAGTEGTVVAVWQDGAAYDVEFADALGPATIAAEFVRAA